MWLVVGVVALVVAVATYLTWLANRVDRLHQRAAGAFAALDSQSVRRAAAAIELGERDGLAAVATAARVVLSAHPDDRELAENDLTSALRAAADKVDPADLAGIIEVNRRLALARQVHTDLVRDALAVRRRRLVRVLGLNRRHPEPRFFDIDEPSTDEP